MGNSFLFVYFPVDGQQVFRVVVFKIGTQTPNFSPCMGIGSGRTLSSEKEKQYTEYF
jgi:hypothetical protein